MWYRLFAKTELTLLLLLMVMAAGVSHAKARNNVHQSALVDEPALYVLIASEAVVQRDQFTLADIGQVVVDQGDENSANNEALQALQLVALGYAPNPGAVRELSKDRILQAIASAGFPAGYVQLQAPQVIHIRRASQIINQTMIVKEVERVALSDLKANGAIGRIMQLNLPAVIQAPAGTTEIRATMGGVKDLFSAFGISIEIWVDGRMVQRISTMVQIEAFAPVLVACRSLAPGERIRSADVSFEPRRLKFLPSRYVRSVEALRGASLRRALNRGEELTADLLYAEKVIKQGDNVRVIGRSDRIYVEVAGEARTAGRIGDRIQVKNLQSGLLLQAIVKDEGVVEVNF